MVVMKERQQSTVGIERECDTNTVSQIWGGPESTRMDHFSISNPYEYILSVPG